jgi:hypothetical protein
MAWRAILKAADRSPANAATPPPPRYYPPPRARTARRIRDGCTEAIMLADGFSIEEMVALSRIGLATAQAERVVAAARTFEVAGGGAKVLCGDKTMTRDHEPETGSGLGEHDHGRARCLGKTED